MARKRAEAGRQEVGGCRDLELFGTGRLGPDPSMIPKQIRVADLGLAAGGRHDVYAVDLLAGVRSWKLWQRRLS